MKFLIILTALFCWSCNSENSNSTGLKGEVREYYDKMVAILNSHTALLILSNANPNIETDRVRSILANDEIIKGLVNDDRVVCLGFTIQAMNRFGPPSIYFKGGGPNKILSANQAPNLEGSDYLSKSQLENKFFNITITCNKIADHTSAYNNYYLYRIIGRFEAISDDSDFRGMSHFFLDLVLEKKKWRYWWTGKLDGYN